IAGAPMQGQIGKALLAGETVRERAEPVGDAVLINAAHAGAERERVAQVPRRAEAREGHVILPDLGIRGIDACLAIRRDELEVENVDFSARPAMTRKQID